MLAFAELNFRQGEVQRKTMCGRRDLHGRRTRSSCLVLRRADKATRNPASN